MKHKIIFAVIVSFTIVSFMGCNSPTHSVAKVENTHTLYLPNIHEQIRTGTYFHIDLVEYLVEEIGYDEVSYLFETSDSSTIYTTLRNNYISIPMIKKAIPQDIYEKYLKYELHKEPMYAMLDEGTYIDIALIEHIGFEEYGDWHEKQELIPTLLDVQNYFEINNEQLKKIVGNDIYALYQEFDYGTFAGIRMVLKGETIDANISDIVGSLVFEDWLLETDKQTIYQLTYDFNISDSQLQSIMSSDSFEIFTQFRFSLPSISEEIITGHYIDFDLVKYIGYEEYKNWLNQIPKTEQTVYELVAFFNIPHDTLQEILPTDVYEYYLLYMPDSFERINASISESEPLDASVYEDEMESPIVITDEILMELAVAFAEDNVADFVKKHPNFLIQNISRGHQTTTTETDYGGMFPQLSIPESIIAQESWSAEDVLTNHERLKTFYANIENNNSDSIIFISGSMGVLYNFDGVSLTRDNYYIGILDDGTWEIQGAEKNIKSEGFLETETEWILHSEQFSQRRYPKFGFSPEPITEETVEAKLQKDSDHSLEKLKEKIIVNGEICIEYLLLDEDGFFFRSFAVMEDFSRYYDISHGTTLKAQVNTKPELIDE